jgi:polysaccharide pyruvyl transferase WcaK-like protein
MRVVIANCYPDDNRGSAALNDAACTVAALAFPGASLSIISAARNSADMTGPCRAGRFRHSLARHPGVDVLPPVLQARRAAVLAEAVAVGRGLLWQAAPRWLGRGPTVAALRAADVVLSRGGYLLADPGSLRWWLDPYLLMLPNRLAHRLRKPTWTLPTSVIPPRTLPGALVLRHLIRSFDRVALRDPRARAAARALGGRDIHVYDDSVFVLEPPDQGAAEAAVARQGLGHRRFAVATTRNWGSPAADARKRALQLAVMRELLDRGEIDQVLVVAQTVGPDLDERPSARALLEQLRPGEGQLMEGDFSHRDLMALYRAADVVVTQHLHSFIFAAMVGTPGLVMSVDGHKVEGLVDGLGLPGWMVIDAASDGPATVLERVRRLRRTRTMVSADLRRASAKARSSVLGFARDLAALQRAG